VKRNAWRIALALAFSAAGLYLALHGIVWAELFNALQQAHWGWIALAAVAMIIELLFRSLRWRILLKNRLPVGEAFGLIGIGYLVSNLIPLRAGDPARAVVAGLRRNIPAVAVLSTVVVERTLDLLTIALLLLVTLPFISSQSSPANSLITGLVAGSLSLIALLGLLWLAFYPAPAEKLARTVITTLKLPQPDRWIAPFHNILEGLQALRTPREGLLLAGSSLGVWGFTLAYYQIVLHAFTPTPPPLAGAVVTWATALGMVAPAPGGLGTTHLAMQQALVLFGFSSSLALAYAFVAHAIQYLAGIVIGAAALLLWGISPSQIKLDTSA